MFFSKFLYSLHKEPPGFAGGYTAPLSGEPSFARDEQMTEGLTALTKPKNPSAQCTHWAPPLQGRLFFILHS